MADFDSLCIIDSGSVKGTGKSVFSIKVGQEVCKLIGQPYHRTATPEKPYTFDPIVFNPKSQDIIALVKSLPDGYPIHIDEASRVGYKRDYQKEGQKDLIKFVKICRKYRKVIILNDPDFWDLDKDLRNLCDYRVIIVKRGMGQVKGKSTNPDIVDKWLRDASADIIAKRLGRQVTNLEKCRQGIRETSGFLYDISFSDMDQKEYEAYRVMSKIEELKGFQEAKDKKRVWIWIIASMLAEARALKGVQMAKEINERLFNSHYAEQLNEFEISPTTVNKWLSNWKNKQRKNVGINNY